MTSAGQWLAQPLLTLTFVQGLAEHKPYLLIAALSWREAASSVAAAFMSKMIPLRALAVVNNIFGIASGLITGAFPTIVKHSINLPLNTTR